MLNRWVLSRDRKTAMEGAEVTRSGRLFQTRATNGRNVQLPEKNTQSTEKMYIIWSGWSTEAVDNTTNGEIRQRRRPGQWYQGGAGTGTRRILCMREAGRAWPVVTHGREGWDGRRGLQRRRRRRRWNLLIGRRSLFLVVVSLYRRLPIASDAPVRYRCRFVSVTFRFPSKRIRLVNEWIVGGVL